MQLNDIMRLASFIIIICMILAFLSTALSMGDDESELKKLISSNEDIRIDVYDLAFFLAMHNYDVVPKDNYVELNLNGSILKLVPNGIEPGLCEIV